MFPYELGQLVLFGGNEEIDQVEKYLHKEVERMLYEPTLPNGGNKERAMIERLKPMALDARWNGHIQAAYAIKQWKSVLPDNPAHAGRYYRRQPMTRKQDKDNFKWYCDLRDSAHTSRLWDQKWFAEMMLEGLPEPVSNFEMECLFLLKKSDGLVDRLVSLRNIMGEVSQGEQHNGTVILDPEAFASPEKFRRWALGHGNFCWFGNQVDLQKLQEDIARWTAWKVIHRVDCDGWRRLEYKTTSES